MYLSNLFNSLSKKHKVLNKDLINIVFAKPKCFSDAKHHTLDNTTIKIDLRNIEKNYRKWYKLPPYQAALFMGKVGQGRPIRGGQGGLPPNVC